MANRWAIFIGIDRYLDHRLTEVRFAENDQRTISESLQSASIPEANQTLLLGNSATKTSIESRLRKWLKSLESNDELFIYFSGHGFTSEGRVYLASHDTDLDDLTETAISIDDWNESFSSRSVRLRWVLDIVPNESETNSIVGFLEEDPLLALAETDPNSLILLASEPGQVSQIAEPLEHRLWGYHLQEAFSGRAKIKNLGSDQRLTAKLLHSYLKSELPRTARKVLSDPQKQVPSLIGSLKIDVLVADLGQAKPATEAKPSINLDQTRRILFRTVNSIRIKDLKGFHKGIRIPESVTSSAKKYLAKIAMEDIRQEIEDIFNAMREHLGFKRKDLEASAERDGFAFIRTPAFDYTILAELDDTDPTVMHFTREVTQIQEPDLIRSPGFQQVFGTRFDTLRFEFSQPIDVPAFVDRFEEEPIKGVKLRTSIDASTCELMVEGFSGTIKLEPLSLVISGRSSSTASLIDQFFEFQKRFTQKRNLLALT